MKNFFIFIFTLVFFIQWVYGEISKRSNHEICISYIFPVCNVNFYKIFTKELTPIAINSIRLENEEIPHEETKIIVGKIGQSIAVVRKDTGKDGRYWGSIKNEESKAIKLNLNFLIPEKNPKKKLIHMEKEWLRINPIQGRITKAQTIFSI